MRIVVHVDLTPKGNTAFTHEVEGDKDTQVEHVRVDNLVTQAGN